MDKIQMDEQFKYYFRFEIFSTRGWMTRLNNSTYFVPSDGVMNNRLIVVQCIRIETHVPEL